VPPRGSTQIQAGDTLHLLVRDEVAGGMPSVLERWRDQRLGPPAPPSTSPEPTLITRPWTAEHGDPADPDLIAGVPVVELLLGRRDTPSALVALEDGRYALSGATLVLGSRGLVRRYARRRLRVARTEAEKRWWEAVIAALGG
jgi:cell volume regulation protein A